VNNKQMEMIEDEDYIQQ